MADRNSSLNPTHAQRQALKAENRRWPNELRRIPQSEWPPRLPPRIAEVWRSRGFLVQVFVAPDGVERLSVCRTSVRAANDRWDDLISWDDLQRLKAECGRGSKAAVEIFPPDNAVVNAANLRHLWVLPEPPPFMWRRPA